MSDEHAKLSAIARRAVQSRDWATVSFCANELVKREGNSAESCFLIGLAEKANGNAQQAAALFLRAVSLDAGRYDAAVELASQYAILLRHRDALDLLRKYESRLGNSPRYLDMAGSIYSRLGLHACAWPLYRKANELQPNIELFRANLASCAVYLGKIEEAKAIYTSLLRKRPDHQKNHYELSRLDTAKDTTHVEQMKAILDAGKKPPENCIFLYYAIGKELEDLGRWQEAFDYYQLAGKKVMQLADYDVATDIAVIDKVIEICNAEWLAEGSAGQVPRSHQKTPIFVVGLPRTGTTVTERIIASHSRVESADESFFLPIVLRQVSGVETRDSMNPAIIESAAKKDIRLIAEGYLQAIDFRLTDKPFFIEKLPENILYLGFIAKAFPDALLIHQRRNPMDTCFAMYKQPYFKFAYTLENVGRYYVAYRRLHRHWAEILKDRLIEVEYESLVSDPEPQIRELLDKLGLEFEPACLHFERNQSPSGTASSVQVREKVHSRSVGKWRNFATQLKGLKNYLQNAGIAVD